MAIFSTIYALRLFLAGSLLLWAKHCAINKLRFLAAKPNVRAQAKQTAEVENKWGPSPPHTPWVKSVGKVSLFDRLALVGLRSGNGEWNPVGTRLGPGQEPGWNPVRGPVGTRSGARLGPG